MSITPLINLIVNLFLAAYSTVTRSSSKLPPQWLFSIYIWYKGRKPRLWYLSGSAVEPPMALLQVAWFLILVKIVPTKYITGQVTECVRQCPRGQYITDHIRQYFHKRTFLYLLSDFLEFVWLDSLWRCVTLGSDTDEAPVPLTGFLSNSKLFKNLECCCLKRVQPITTQFCTLRPKFALV